LEIQLSSRVQRIKPSPTLAVSARAAKLQAEGQDIIGLGAGEPDLDTPLHIKQAAIAAIEAGFTKYTAVGGILELKEAIRVKFQRDNQLTYTHNQILVSSGGKQSFFNLAQALLNDGDEAIIPAPYWVSYPDIVLLAGGKPVILPTSIKNRFKITPEQLEAAITPKTRLFVINSPSNPSGVAYTQAELKALGAVLMRHPNVLVATDDMYEHLWWMNEPFANIVTLCPELYERAVVLNGVSKAYAMTGWRIGYAAGPEPLMKAMENIQGQSTSNPNSIAQKAAVAALKGPQECVQDMCHLFKERHDYLVAALNAIPGVQCLRGDGTFYVFPNVEGIIRRLGLQDDSQLAEYLIAKAGVAFVPGSAFGSPGYLRLSFSVHQSVLEEAVRRLSHAVGLLPA
jgi:aspartate aminotransferase